MTEPKLYQNDFKLLMGELCDLSQFSGTLMMWLIAGYTAFVNWLHLIILCVSNHQIVGYRGSFLVPRGVDGRFNIQKWTLNTCTFGFLSFPPLVDVSLATFQCKSKTEAVPRCVLAKGSESIFSYSKCQPKEELSQLNFSNIAAATIRIFSIEAWQAVVVRRNPLLTWRNLKQDQARVVGKWAPPDEKQTHTSYRQVGCYTEDP